MTLDLPFFLIRFALTVLAVYRLAWIITREDGPFGIFEGFRLWLGKRAAAETDQHEGRSLAWTIAELSNCAHCAGVWLALLFAPAVIWPHLVTDCIILVFAIAGAQSYLTGRGDE